MIGKLAVGSFINSSPRSPENKGRGLLDLIDFASHRALWEAKSIRSNKPLPLFSGDLGDEFINEPTANLPIMTTGEEIIEDYAALRFSLRAHPIALLRSYLTPVH